MRFAKAHGLGNDFILVAEDLAPAELSPWAVRLCDRHRGIGGDGVVLHAPTADGVSFKLVNADGLVGEISGNGLRCLAALAVRNGWAPARHVVTTVVGKKAVEVSAVSPSVYRIVTDLGPPALGSRDVPVALEPPAETVIDHPLEAGGRTVRVTATSMGNPHCAVFLDAPADDGLLRSLGPALEFHPFFPRRTNVEFVTVVSPSRDPGALLGARRGLHDGLGHGLGERGGGLDHHRPHRPPRAGRLRRRHPRDRVARGRIRPPDRRGRDPLRGRVAGPPGRLFSQTKLFAVNGLTAKPLPDRIS